MLYNCNFKAKLLVNRIQSMKIFHPISPPSFKLWYFRRQVSNIILRQKMSNMLNNSSTFILDQKSPENISDVYYI